MKPGEILERDRGLREQPVHVPGKIVENVLIPPRGYMPAREVDKGRVFRIIDVEGGQVPDVMLFDRHDLKNISSCANTTLLQKKWKISEGDVIYSKYGDVMAAIVRDTVKMNVFSGGFCSAEVNGIRYGIEGTPNCRSNLAASMARYRVCERDLELDGNFSPFMDMGYETDGGHSIRPPSSKPGDHIDIRAEIDLIVAISNCPQERNCCNNWYCTYLRFIVYDPD
ncbi:MAG: DUF1989 domain-containing protein [Firmicutes bacterium]|nr:DUF1989 domain-containing protein [Bacillota bacterium]